MRIQNANRPGPDALADKAEAAVARMTQAVHDGKEQIKRLHRIMAKIDSLKSTQQ
jgi:hypothetical protein